MNRRQFMGLTLATCGVTALVPFAGAVGKPEVTKIYGRIKWVESD